MRNLNIPVCEPFLGGKEKVYVNDALDRNWISSRGDYVKKFEEMFARFLQVKYATTVSNGTNAIHLGLKALDINPYDEVIMPNFTMICSALPVCYLGAKPVFVDAEPETWNINPSLIEEKITNKTEAVMVVHIYGHPCDMKPIWELARKYKLKIIEDAAESHGAVYFGKKCGKLGNLAAFSFFSNKIVTTGEGGMVSTDDEELYDRLKYYKDLCFPSSGERNYIHEDIGFQYRLSNIQAAIGVAQMERITDYIEMRKRNNSLYRKYLNDVPGISFQPKKSGCKNVYWVNAAIIDKEKFGISRDKLMKELDEKGIQTRKFFVPMHRQPALKKCTGIDGDNFPISNWLAENGLYFPSSTGLTEKQIEMICSIIKKIRDEKIK